MISGHAATSPLPSGEREGPAPSSAWEGEGARAATTEPVSTSSTLTPLAARVALSPEGRGKQRFVVPAAATPRARALRSSATDAERKLWSVLRGGKVNGHKFRRQVPIGRYIADFVCPSHKIVVEADGGQHAPEVDFERTRFLESQGYAVLRYWNNVILTNVTDVQRDIAAHLPPKVEGAPC